MYLPPAFAAVGMPGQLTGWRRWGLLPGPLAAHRGLWAAHTLCTPGPRMGLSGHWRVAAVQGQSFRAFQLWGAGLEP